MEGAWCGGNSSSWTARIALDSLGSRPLAPDLALREHPSGLEEIELLRVRSPFLKKLDIELPRDSAISFLHIYTK